jgi:hypothetical protein
MIKSSRNGENEQEYDFESRIISARSCEEDDEREAEVSLRPKSLNEYVGQEKVKEKLDLIGLKFRAVPILTKQGGELTAKIRIYHRANVNKL